MSNPTSQVEKSKIARSIPWWKIFLVLFLGAITALGFYIMPPIDEVGAAGISMKLPYFTGMYYGVPQEVSEKEYFLLPEDTEFAKMLYTGPNFEQINVQIVLAGAEKRSIHRPEICLRSQGWTIATRTIIPITLDNGETMEVMQLLLNRPVEVSPGEFRPLTSVYLYWFVGNKVTTPHHWQRLALTSWDRIVNRKNHRWAYVIVSAPVLKDFTAKGLNLSETNALLEKFVAKISPEIVLKWKNPNENTD